MSLRLLAIELDARDPERVAAFWAALLDREVVEDGDGFLLRGDETQVGLRFAVAPDLPHEPGSRELHLHVTSEDEEDRGRTVETVQRLGGRYVDVGQLPSEDHVVLGDPEGKAFCVIEPGSGFLAGCGRLGEIACDGGREVGAFWSEALGWPLVWDQDDETAVQSPRGGTKIAWGGAPAAPKQPRNPQRFRLGAADIDAETERLVALGATRLGSNHGQVELADPEGNELRLTSVP